MSVHFEAARNRWVVRWRQDGRNRSKRVASGDAAEAFDESVRRPRVATTPVASISHGDGIHAYGTTAGVRFRFVFRQSDGTMSSRRGFTSRQAATAARRRLVESIERGEVKVTRESFGTFWAQLLRERRPYLTAGSFADVEAHRRKRLMPAFEHVPLARMDEKHVRAWVTGMAQRVESGKISAKTINNARTCLAVALNEACRRGLIARNPCDGVPPLPVVQEEIDYLRLAEIEPYLGGCADFYRPLAETLLGTGARISGLPRSSFRVTRAT